MEFFESVKMSLFDKYFCFKGRASKQEFWYFGVFLISGMILIPLLTFVICEIIGLGGIDEVVTSFLIFDLLTAIPYLAICVRRLHDSGESGWTIIKIAVICSFMLIFGPLVMWCWLYSSESINENNE